ncbi:MAG: phospholipid carrier-dependent glycosyltransferase, partial [Fulvivirga sp.]|nr:phospholipid carrier-dependent glycosyltransferase [Fulvivirga sp.]
MSHILKQKRSTFTYLIIILVTFGIAYAYSFDKKVALLGDNAYYYILGKALAEGEGYVNISKVSKSPNNHYPPGYPAIISVVRFLGGEVMTVKLLNGLFLLGSAWLIFFLAVKVTENEPLSFIVSLITILNAHSLYYASIMMSEVPFMFFSLLSLYLFIRADKDQPSFRDINLIGSVLCMIMAYYLRSLGVALFAGYFLYFAFRKQWKPVVVFFVAL